MEGARLKQSFSACTICNAHPLTLLDILRRLKMLAVRLVVSTGVEGASGEKPVLGLSCLQLSHPARLLLAVLSLDAMESSGHHDVDIDRHIIKVRSLGDDYDEECCTSQSQWRVL